MQPQSALLQTRGHDVYKRHCQEGNSLYEPICLRFLRRVEHCEKQ